MDWTRWTRRDFLKTSSVTGMGIVLGGTMDSRAPRWMHDAQREGALTLRDPRVKPLAQRALDAARRAGAQYADVRLSYARGKPLFRPYARESLGISVRALVNGYWGFAGSPYTTDAEAVHLGQTAAASAKSLAARAPRRVVDLGQLPPVVNGDWTTPITIDPFTMAGEESVDWMCGFTEFARARKALMQKDRGIELQVTKNDGVFASTEGSYITQTVHKIGGFIGFGYGGESEQYSIDFGRVCAGWEFVHEMPVRELLLRKIAEIEEDRKLPRQPLEIGRYDVVCDAPVMANLLNATLAPATQLDRALGYEANEGGTSYLGPDPTTVLGTAVASPLVTLTANRSVPHGLATVKWDDEGVLPEDFTLIKDGMLVDYQTTREQAAWLAPWYQQRGQPVRSHGCAGSDRATTMMMQHTPNIAMLPGPSETELDDLVRGLKQGVQVSRLGVRNVDQQCLNGVGLFWGPGAAYHIKDGQRIARVSGPATAILFRSPEIWKKSLAAIGGAKSLRWFGIGTSKKGKPEQAVDYSIGAVPALLRQLTFIDPARKA